MNNLVTCLSIAILLGSILGVLLIVFGPYL